LLLFEIVLEQVPEGGVVQAVEFLPNPPPALTGAVVAALVGDNSHNYPLP
jgi:hypothetical protein